MKEYIFVCDIGNTSISFGVFSDETLLCKSKVLTSSKLDEMIDAIKKMVKDHSLEEITFSGGLISSVVPTISRLVQIAIESVVHALIPIMDAKYNSLVKIAVDNKEEVGGDLLADIAFAISKYQGPTLIVDLGTITKMLFVDENNVFSGANFFPGFDLCKNVMGEKTALLPELNKNQKPLKYFGSNTLDAMNAGLYFGTLNMIVGYKNHLKEKYTKINLLLTGGYSSLLKDDLADFIYDEDLTLKGVLTLYRLGEKNGL